jgi:hypothetical protein
MIRNRQMFALQPHGVISRFRGTRVQERWWNRHDSFGCRSSMPKRCSQSRSGERWKRRSVKSRRGRRLSTIHGGPDIPRRCCILVWTGHPRYMATARRCVGICLPPRKTFLTRGPPGNACRPCVPSQPLRPEAGIV